MRDDQSNQQLQGASFLYGSEREAIVRLALQASLEMTVHDVAQLRAASELLGPNRRVYVSHLPGQAWSATVAACREVDALGAVPIPHVPVRCVRDRSSLQRFLSDCETHAGVREFLLIAGDYPHSVGPYNTTMDVLNSGVLGESGIRRLSVAGHPEGHALVTPDELRRAEREKIEFALRNEFTLTFLTQFFFEAEPFVAWRRGLPIPESADEQVRVVAGLAGPAKLTTLLRYAAICGIGPSIRALHTRGASIGKMLGERGPESIVRTLAGTARPGICETFGMHLFSFGGLVRTCAWLDAVANGRFRFGDEHGFIVRDRE